MVGGLRRACVGLVGPEGSIPPTLPAADSVRAQRAGEAVCAGAAARGGCKHDPAAKAEGMRRVSMMSSGLVTYPTKPHPSCAPGAHTAQEGSASWRAGQGKGGGGGAAAASSYWAVLPAPASASRRPKRRLGSRAWGVVEPLPRAPSRRQALESHTGPLRRHRRIYTHITPPGRRGPAPVWAHVAVSRRRFPARFPRTRHALPAPALRTGSQRSGLTASGIRRSLSTLSPPPPLARPLGHSVYALTPPHTPPLHSSHPPCAARLTPLHSLFPILYFETSDALQSALTPHSHTPVL